MLTVREQNLKNPGGEVCRTRGGPVRGQVALHPGAAR